MRVWKPHFGHTIRFFSRSVRYSTASHDTHLIHRPSGTGVLRTPGVLLIRGGSSLVSQLIGSVRSCRAFSGHRVERGTDASQPLSRARSGFAGRRLLDLLDDAAADD